MDREQRPLPLQTKPHVSTRADSTFLQRFGSMNKFPCYLRTALSANALWNWIRGYGSEEEQPHSPYASSPYHMHCFKHFLASTCKRYLRPIFPPSTQRGKIKGLRGPRQRTLRQQISASTCQASKCPRRRQTPHLFGADSPSK